MEKKLPETYIFNEDLTVKENKEKLEKYNDYYKNEQKVYEKLLNDTRLAIQHELGIDLELSEKLINRYFRYSRSIFTCYYDIKKDCEFFKQFMEYAREHLSNTKGE